MIIDQRQGGRHLIVVKRSVDVVVVGGGLAGVCAAIAAAREGMRVILVQDRPVLGGNSSSEVRLWVLGATSHMGNNNRWAREGGIIDELLVENMYRNPEGNALILDTILLEKVMCEPNIELLLNTAVFNLVKADADKIEYVEAFCSQNQSLYQLEAPAFIDASGDGIVGFLAGAAFRMGAESKEEFGESFAPSAEYGELLGHSIYFYSKDVGRPVQFVPPSFAIKDITSIPRYKSFNAKDYGCRLWWIEYGGRLDTVTDTEKIKWELWKVVYGVWNYIKNSGEFPEAENLTLEWVGHIPGKRESRRFEGDYMIRQQDIVEQRTHADAVSFGGWSIDLHPADGVFSEKPGCNQWHSKGIYQVPYRALYSRNVSNLFLAGRLISATHVAFGSTRVMATCAAMAQVVGTAAAICIERNISPRAIYSEGHIGMLQQRLLLRGAYIPGVKRKDGRDLVHQARLKASSEFSLSELPEHNIAIPIRYAVAQMIPLPAGEVPCMTFHATAEADTLLQVAIRISESAGNHTPEITLWQKVLPIHPGRNCLQIEFDAEMPERAYAYVTFESNPGVQLHYSRYRVTGLLSVSNQVNPSVSNYGRQDPPPGIGMDAFEFWCPARRPLGYNLAFKIAAPLRTFGAEMVRNGVDRPTCQPNAWVADLNDQAPYLALHWGQPQSISRVELYFDTDFDHPMETVLMGHPENVMPFCIRDYSLEDGEGNLLCQVQGNYQSRNVVHFKQPVETDQLIFRCRHPHADVPASLFAIRCY